MVLLWRLVKYYFEYCKRVLHLTLKTDQLSQETFLQRRNEHKLVSKSTLLKTFLWVSKCAESEGAVSVFAIS